MVLPKDDTMKTETLKTEFSLYISVCYFFLLRGIVLTIVLPLGTIRPLYPYVIILSVVSSCPVEYYLGDYKTSLSVCYYIVRGIQLSSLVLSRGL